MDTLSYIIDQSAGILNFGLYDQVLRFRQKEGWPPDEAGI
jgi:hypothetical protein